MDRDSLQTSTLLYHRPFNASNFTWNWTEKATPAVLEGSSQKEQQYADIQSKRSSQKVISE